MQFSLAARARSSTLKEKTIPSASDRGVYTSVAALAELETSARGFSFLRRQPVHSLLSGRYGSRIHGRGLAFEELRQYMAGDDTRTIDWRVTARASKPYVRVYTEEKDRPVILVVDQRINMFFGSVRSMKSVTAAEVAALCAWRAIGEGDRVGGIVFGDDRIDQLRPARSRAAVVRFTETLTKRNRELRADTSQVRTPAQLDVALEAAANAASRDHLILVVSDFDGHGSRTRDLLLRLASANQVIAILVYDPFLLKLPPSGDIVVGGDELQIELGLAQSDLRRDLAKFADERAREILGWQRQIGITVIPISAAEAVAPQIRHLLGQSARQAVGR